MGYHSEIVELMSKHYWAEAPELQGKLPRHWTTTPNCPNYKLGPLQVAFSDFNPRVPYGTQGKHPPIDMFPEQWRREVGFYYDQMDEYNQVEATWNPLRVYIRNLSGKQISTIVKRCPELLRCMPNNMFAQFMPWEFKKVTREELLEQVELHKKPEPLPENAAQALELLYLIRLGEN
jgi:hypothetical protein